ncbi:MAG TPA: hypothetical protein VMT63_01560 [Bacteroidales bacterium]|nr:hypothetical protein [Bacteroidales bacterium]
MDKSGKFEESLQKIARWCMTLSHPARLAMPGNLAGTGTCNSVDISGFTPLEELLYHRVIMNLDMQDLFME